MATETQSNTELGVIHTEELDALQTILATQSSAISYKEVADIGRELLGFFEALGEENECIQDDDSYA